MANRTKITMARARAFAPANEREAVLWDSAAPGLGLPTIPCACDTAFGVLH